MAPFRLPPMDDRLRAAADWVTPCMWCADIGCDHGHLGAVLLKENRVQRLLASDVSSKALDKAKACMARLGVKERTTFVLADGLTALDALPEGRADTICILGMGGATMVRMLQNGRDRLHGASLVLGPQTELAAVRTALEEGCYELVQERIVYVSGKFYVLMQATPAPRNATPYTHREKVMGPCLLKGQSPLWEPWLKWRIRGLRTKTEAMIAAAAKKDEERLAQALLELRYTQEALREVPQPPSLFSFQKEGDEDDGW